MSPKEFQPDCHHTNTNGVPRLDKLIEANPSTAGVIGDIWKVKRGAAVKKGDGKINHGQHIRRVPVRARIMGANGP